MSDKDYHNLTSMCTLHQNIFLKNVPTAGTCSTKSFVTDANLHIILVNVYSARRVMQSLIFVCSSMCKINGKRQEEFLPNLAEILIG